MDWRFIRDALTITKTMMGVGGLEDEINDDIVDTISDSDSFDLNDTIDDSDWDMTDDTSDTFFEERDGFSSDQEGDLLNVSEQEYQVSQSEYHPTFGYKDNLYTKNEIDSHKHEAQNEIDYQKSRIERIKKDMSYEASHNASKAKIDSLQSSLNSAKRELDKAKAKLKAWEDTKPKKQD